MKTLLESDEFRAELPGWALRGILCAANSAVWAGLSGFNAPTEIAGMVAGTALWVVVFTAVSSWGVRTGRETPRQWIGAFKVAAWIKFLLVLAGVPGVFGVHFLASGFGILVLGTTVDLVLGACALGLVSPLAGLTDLEQVSRLDSFGWTMLATVIQGAFVALVIAGIALGVWGLARFWPGLKIRLVSPARSAGQGGV